ncbi:hypothetical protein [Candidatus Magnetomonas plexicatena]|uniref:hypothetical protein n=1 Tax=Candidatus Magnetomonas plexicatena TaxID=2552947 RepID=UPI001C7697ED|nr:hypothetical protein E2O03_000765 [Nitrospirales bacterium LBB_01]
MKTKILITVKTYPTLSAKYDEIVCTAGFREDGTWVRLYPIPFRKLDYEKQYKKYQWIELKIERNSSDPRKESYRPVNINDIVTGVWIEPTNYWRERKEIVLKKVYTNMEILIEEAKNPDKCTSLAVFKPSEIIDFKFTKTVREWDKVKLAQLDQLKLYEKNDNPFKVVKKLPYKFSYIFMEDSSVERTLMIEDWEIGQLFWNCCKKHNGDEIKACNDVKKKYFDDFAKTKDLYFYLGTTREFHFHAKNPFIIIGTFHPMIEPQDGLF